MREMTVVVPERGTVSWRARAVVAALAAMLLVTLWPATRAAAAPAPSLGPNVIVLNPTMSAGVDPGHAGQGLHAAGAQPVRL